MRASFLYIVVLLCKIIKFICRFFGFLHRAPSAARSVSVRHPVRLRPPPGQIAFAARSDCVRRPVRLRPPSDQIASAVRLLVLMFYGENTKHL